MRKLLLIVFVLICGLVEAQNGPCTLIMEKTWFCQGETIHFGVDFECWNEFVHSFPDNQQPGNLHIYGPLNNPLPSGSQASYPDYNIQDCTPRHSGVYRLICDLYNQPNYIMDEVEIHVVAVNVGASANPPTVSPGGGTTLYATGADYYIWSPAAYLDDTIGEEVHAIIPADIDASIDCIDFTVTGFSSGDNRVTNGDFEQSGNCSQGYGFGSDYDCYNPSSNVLYPHSAEGGFSIHDNANYIHQDFHNPPNNAGHDKFMIINGDPTAGAPYRVIWTETISVRPGVQYAFSADVCTFVNRNYARLQFSINGTLIGEVFDARPSAQGWQTFYAIWEGSSSNTATITLVNLQTAGDGNDFGIDNISFYDLMECSADVTIPVCIKRKIEVGDIETPDIICDDEILSVQPPQINDSTGHPINIPGSWWLGQTPTPPPTINLGNNLNNSPISSEYDGWYLFYVVPYQGTNYYSNAVPIMVIPPINVHIEVEGDNPAVCPDDTITLTAVADTIVLNYVSVGDILCEDGGTVKRAKWLEAAADGRVAKGIVFYVDDTKRHGWAVSLTQVDNKAWSTEQVNVGNTYSNWRLAITDFDGYGNTQAIRARTGSTPATYPAVWNVDFANGWYLPAAGQLNMLFCELPEVNLSLNRVGGTPIVIDNVYPGTTHPGGKLLLWSSTQGSGSQYAIVVQVSDGWVGNAPKTNSTKYSVRAVITF